MTPIFFMVGYALGLILTFVRHPIYGLYTYFFAFYMAPSYGWWRNEIPDLRYMFIAGIATVIATLFLSRDKDRPQFYETTPGKLFLMFVVFNWLQTMWAFNQDAQIEAATLFTKHLVSFYLIYTFANCVERIKEIAFFHVIGCGWFGYQALGAGGGRLETIGGPVAGSNELGVHISTGLIFGGLLILSLKGIRRLIVFSVMPFVANCLVLTISRGAFLGFFLGGIGGYFAAPKKITKVYLLLGALGLALVMMLSHDAMIERFTESWRAMTTDEKEIDVSAASRVEIAKAGIRIGLDHPFGAGSTATERMSGRYLTYFDTGRSAHNTLAEVFAEHGFPGLILYVLIIVWVCRTILEMRRTPQSASDTDQEIALLMTMVGGALIAIFVSGNFSSNLGLETQYWCLALLAAIVALKDNVRLKEQATTNAVPSTENNTGLQTLKRAIGGQRPRVKGHGRKSLTRDTEASH